MQSITSVLIRKAEGDLEEDDHGSRNTKGYVIQSHEPRQKSSLEKGSEAMKEFSREPPEGAWSYQHFHFSQGKLIADFWSPGQ